MTEKSAKITTPVFRVSFPAVFQPKAPMAGATGDPKYSVQMLFNTDPAKGPVADLQPMKNAVKAAIVERWGPDQAKWPKGLMLPFRKGEEKDYDGYGPGVIFVSATSKQRPGLVDRDLQPIIDPSEFYGGCYARATINAFAWPGEGKQGFGKFGVSFGLQNIQKVKDGDAFSGKSAADKDFDAIAVPEGASKAENTVDDGLGLN